MSVQLRKDYLFPVIFVDLIELLSTKNAYHETSSVIKTLLSTNFHIACCGTWLLFAYPENHEEIWLVFSKEENSY